MKILITGVNGQVGHDVLLEMNRRGHSVTGSGSSGHSLNSDATAVSPYLQIDITDMNSVSNVFRTVQPDVVVHCSAWTAVDAAEEEENREKVYALNVTGVKNLAIACREYGAKLIYISTDYVFNGNGTEPWAADREDYAPLCYYGETKLLGEKAVQAQLKQFYIVRTAWVFGVNGANFVRTMVKVGKSHDSVRVVMDQIGTPTYSKDLARLLADMAETDRYGIYHATNEGGYISWYEFCCEIYRQYGLETKVLPVTTEEYGQSKAKRPKNSRLNRSKLVKMGFEPLPDWRDALGRFLKEAEL